MSGLTPAGLALVQLMAAAPRGPKREGLFALWLTVRVIEDLPLQGVQVDRAFRRRVTLLDQRLSSLALPPPLRRGLTGALTRLREASRSEAGQLLSLLAGPARDAIGPEASELLHKAGRSLR